MRHRQTIPFLQGLAALVLAALAAMPASAAPAGDAAVQTPLRDPWVPPALRRAASAPQTEGAALRAQVERKLRASFDAADRSGSGTLTREQARAAGFGIVADNFDRIDSGRNGRVSFEDLKRYLRQRGARL